MLELILLIISLLCVFFSAEVSVFFLILTVATVIGKRYTRRDDLAQLRREFEELKKRHQAQLQENSARLENLAHEMAALRAAGVPAAPEVKAPKVSEATEQPKPVAVPPPISAPVQAKPTPPTQEPNSLPVESKPVVPVPEPTKPAVPPATVKPPATPPPAPPTPATAAPIPPPPPPVMPPRPAASYQAPLPVAPLRSPVAQPKPTRTVQERMKSVFALEEVLGTNWLNKLGVVILVLGLALFGIYELGQLGAAGKVGLLIVVGAGLLGGGIYLERKERYQILGRAGIGGGWALLFFTTYAMHHVQAMQILASETTDMVLMLGVAVAMALHTLRYKSQFVTGLAFLLAYSTIALSHDTVYALSAGAVLAIGVVIITVRMQWYELEIFAILSSYLNHFYWLYKILGPEGANRKPFPQFAASVAILLVYWVSYRVSYVVRKIATAQQESVSAIAAVLNTLLLLGVMKFQSVRPELAFYALLVLGALEFAFGQLPVTRRRRKAFVLLSILGAALMVLAVPFKFSGNNVAVLWFVGAEVFLAAGILLREVVFRRLGMITGILAGLHVLIIDCTKLYEERMLADTPVVAGGVLLFTCGVLFYINAHYVMKRWRDFFVESIDQKMLVVHSYFGAITVTLAAWALFVLDWTAVAWAAIFVALAWLGRKLCARELYLQASVVAALTFLRTFAINMHLDRMFHDHVMHVANRYWTVPLIAAGFYLGAWWIVQKKQKGEEYVRHLFAWGGTVLLAFLIWGEVPYRWQPLAFIGMALLLAEASRLLKYTALTWHVHVLTAVAVANAVLFESQLPRGWHGVNRDTLVLTVLAAAVYWLARRVSTAATAFVANIRDSYTWAGSFVMAWLLWLQVPEAWIAVAWMAFAVVLALVGRRWNLAQLCVQENVLAVCAVFALFAFNYPLQATNGVFNLRLVPVALVAAGLYGISRKSTLAGAGYGRQAAYLHTWVATGLLTWLAWYEAPSPWLAVIWAVFALGLAGVGRAFQLEELPWQAHVLALLSVMRAVTVNLHLEDKFHGLSLRLVSLTIIIAILYVLARVIPMPETQRRREFHHAYSWVASVLAALLMWYELQPINVAVAWALFALVLFELGQLRNIRQLRLQAYAGLLASFIRIFFVNLAAQSQPGELFGPRMTTVVPLALIYFFVYAQMRVTEKEESRWDIRTILAYVGSLTVAALLYFQVPGGWIATAWSVMVFALLAASVMLDREVFLHQALLLTLATFSRGVMHNLYGASYFTDAGWTGRYMELGSAVLIMLVSLPFAFRLKNKYKPYVERGRLRNMISLLSSRPEQVMFFVPIVLLTLMLALKMREGMVTVSWGLEGVLVILLALAVNERSFRLSGLALLLLCVGKILTVDAWRLAPRDRYVTFIILGLALLAVSFLYSRYRETIRQYL